MLFGLPFFLTKGRNVKSIWTISFILVHNTYWYVRNKRAKFQIKVYVEKKLSMFLLQGMEQNRVLSKTTVKVLCESAVWKQGAGKPRSVGLVALLIVVLLSTFPHGEDYLFFLLHHFFVRKCSCKKPSEYNRCSWWGNLTWCRDQALSQLASCYPMGLCFHRGMDTRHLTTRSTNKTWRLVD